MRLRPGPAAALLLGLVAILAIAPPAVAQPRPVAAAAQEAEPESEAGRLARLAEAVLDYELATIKDEPLTPRRLILSLLVLAISWYVARRLSRFVGRAVLSRLHVGPAFRALLQSMVFYVFLIFGAILALDLANVPLTLFTVIGGAVAIGVGFGSQAIINNFISGILLLMERTVKPGDLIDIGDTYGTVERIGGRATIIRTPQNTHVVVPNSHLLENPVLNWTLSDDLVRTTVTIGVAYGSDTKLVERLLGEAIAGDEQILREPEPIILFSDFGADALVFQAHFWLHLTRMMDRRKVESALRFRIDALFREHEVVIAYPQRDVHLDVVRPVEVRLSPPGGDDQPPRGSGVASSNRRSSSGEAPLPSTTT